MFFDSGSMPRRRQQWRRPLRRAWWIIVESWPGLSGFFKTDPVSTMDAKRCDIDGWCDRCDRSFLGSVVDVPELRTWTTTREGKFSLE